MGQRRRSKNELGKQAEETAAAFLAAAGLRILARNVRQGRLELDLVCEDGADLVFVEVRSATTSYLESPAETVDDRKQRHVIRAASAYVQDKGLGECLVRFDVLAVRFEAGQHPVVDWLKDAFRPEPSARARRLS
jgi:putative endonuclease